MPLYWQKQAIVGKRNRADFKGGCIETGYRESQVVQFRFEGSSYGFGCIFPFPDCVEIAHGEGIGAVIQPGGSIRDNESIAYCDEHDMSMVFTGVRHFKH